MKAKKEKKERSFVLPFPFSSLESRNKRANNKFISAKKQKHEGLLQLITLELI